MATVTVAAQPINPAPTPSKFREGQILIKPRRNVALSSLAATQKPVVLRHFKHLDLQLIQLQPGVKVLDAVQQYRASGAVDLAEPDYVVEGAVTPNDPFFRANLLWGLDEAKFDADIDAPEGWEGLNSASNVVVAVIDTGVRYTHEDLAANMWINPGEVPGNGVDDDHNGVIDDVHGINAITGSGDPKDDHGHGTHIAGVMGAVGNNGKGMVGVAWKVQIMACKFLDNENRGSVSDAIECIQYARTQGAQIINASWSIPYHSVALQNAIKSARNDGIIFVTAAGNEALDIDITPRYPAGYDFDNIVVVASTTRTREFDSTLSNYGATSVDLAAPGISIYSTWYSSDASYQFLSGTSMAAPFVSGVLALMRANYPNEDYKQLIARLLATTDPIPTLAGKTVTGGCVNLRKALGIREQTTPITPPATTVQIGRVASGGELNVKLQGQAGKVYVLQTSADMVNWSSLSTNVASGDGFIQLIDSVSGPSAQRYYRGVSLP